MSKYEFVDNILSLFFNKEDTYLPQTLILLIPIYSKPNVVNLRYFKLIIMLDQIIGV